MILTATSTSQEKGSDRMAAPSDSMAAPSDSMAAPSDSMAAPSEAVLNIIEKIRQGSIYPLGGSTGENIPPMHSSMDEPSKGAIDLLKKHGLI